MLFHKNRGFHEKRLSRCDYSQYVPLSRREDEGRYKQISHDHAHFRTLPKYGDLVHVFIMDEYPTKLCDGTHVARIGELAFQNYRRR